MKCPNYEKANERSGSLCCISIYERIFPDRALMQKAKTLSKRKGFFQNEKPRAPIPSFLKYDILPFFYKV